jgi:hypothetical protein
MGERTEVCSPILFLNDSQKNGPQIALFSSNDERLVCYDLVFDKRINIVFDDATMR